MKPLQHIVILGGGSAGWLAATYLNRALGNRLKITLIESKKIGRIGVGEATVPTLRATLDYLGLKDSDWMPAVKGSFKLAIRFQDWKKPQRGKPHVYYHPFHHQREHFINMFGATYFMDLDGRLPLPHQWWHEFKNGETSLPMAEACTPNVRLCEEIKAPYPLKAPGKSVNYAFHFDAILFADYLKNVAIERGVQFIEGNLDSVEIGSNGDIAALKLKEGRRVDGDFFIDASGFQAHLLDKALKVPFRSANDRLLCDSAVAFSVPYENVERELVPFTSANALSAGWSWNIPLQHRIGAGYVYSSKFLSQDDAEAEFRSRLGGADDRSVTVNKIDMRIGTHEHVWERNCLAIGLAGSFIEPLESTSIFMTEFQLFQFVRHFPSQAMEAGLRSQYNRKIRACFDEVLDFIVMHYVLSDRDDTGFWRESRSPERISDSLREKLELFKCRLPLTNDFPYHLFGSFNYSCILAGMGYLPESDNPLYSYLETEEGRRALSSMSKRAGEMSESFPPLHRMLREMAENPV